MGKPPAVNEGKPKPARWPFDPMQPARLPEELERVQKQTGAGRKAPREPGKAGKR
jgi:hypothetical protein